MITIVLVIHLLIALALIAVVLLQRSEGGALGIGGGGGGGGGGAMFSSRGAGNALTRATAVLAAAFFITSISLTMLTKGTITAPSVLEEVDTTGEERGTDSVLPSLPDSGAPLTPQVPSE